ncbi:hypothetical protein ACWGMO_33655 [Nocardia salmonicida]
MTSPFPDPVRNPFLPQPNGPGGWNSPFGPGGRFGWPDADGRVRWPWEPRDPEHPHDPKHPHDPNDPKHPHDPHDPKHPGGGESGGDEPGHGSGGPSGDSPTPPPSRPSREDDRDDESGSSPGTPSSGGPGGGPSGGGNSGGGNSGGGPSGGGNSGGGNSGGGNSGGSYTPPSNTSRAPIEVEPDKLMEGGKRLAELPSLSGGLFDILTRLSDNLDRLGQPWGDDELGEQFAAGDKGYLSAVDALVGNASTGSNAEGAIPVFGQLLVNYGRSVEAAGKAFSLGEDLYAQWILTNYVNEDAHGNPGPYKGPLSSDPNFGKNSDADNPPKSGGGGGQSGGGDSGGSGGGTSGGASGAGDGSGSSAPGGAGAGLGSGGAPVANYAQSPSPDGSTVSGLADTGSDLGSSLGSVSGSPLTDAITTETDGQPGVVAPLGYRAIDPTTGLPVDKSALGGGSPGGGRGGPSVPGTLQGRVTEAAYDGEKLATRSTAATTGQRAGASATMIPPGMPGMPVTGASPQGGAAGESKNKRKERRKPAQEVEQETTPQDAWQRAGWRSGQ